MLYLETGPARRRRTNVWRAGPNTSDGMDMNAHPLLLLDIDGVMNTTGSCLRHHSGEVFATEAVVALRWLLIHSKAQVVITSTRRRAGLEAMRALFARNGLPTALFPLIGTTPVLLDCDDDRLREEEITCYLESLAHPLPLFLILDDKPIRGPLAVHWLGIDPDHGLTLSLAREALSRLQR